MFAKKIGVDVLWPTITRLSYCLPMVKSKIFLRWQAEMRLGTLRSTMKPILNSKVTLLALLCASVAASAAEPAFLSWAKTPPMGWNSWDCYGAGVWESNVIANTDYMADHLKAHGWDIITIDIQWYEPLAHTTAYRRGAVLEMDANGRLLPATNRFPMTAATHSFKPIADYIHAKGLRFGLHLMRGIPRQAVDRDNSPILGTTVKAADIANKRSTCGWNTDMYGVDMTKPGAQEYYDSVFALMASWGLDYVKVDDLSRPYHKDEIEAIRKAIDRSGRNIVLSTSPGATPVSEGEHVQTHANLWRISDDFWDDWRTLNEQFARLNSWTPYRGPGHWPDADMLPLGNVRAWQTRDNWTHFTKDEQYTLMSLWCIARSPLIMGGNMPKNDDFTLSLMTNDEVLAVDQNSENNRQLFNAEGAVAWLADVPGSKAKYLGIFNTTPAPAPRGRRGGGPAAGTGQTGTNAVPAESTQPRSISVSLTDAGFSGAVKVRDLWSHKDLGNFTGKFAQTINSHGAGLYRLDPQN
jgi:alpha-galactosidase